MSDSGMRLSQSGLHAALEQMKLDDSGKVQEVEDMMRKMKFGGSGAPPKDETDDPSSVTGWDSDSSLMVRERIPDAIGHQFSYGREKLEVQEPSSSAVVLPWKQRLENYLEKQRKAFEFAIPFDTMAVVADEPQETIADWPGKLAEGSVDAMQSSTAEQQQHPQTATGMGDGRPVRFHRINSAMKRDNASSRMDTVLKPRAVRSKKKHSSVKKRVSSGFRRALSDHEDSWTKELRTLHNMMLWELGYIPPRPVAPETSSSTTTPTPTGPLRPLGSRRSWHL